MPSPLTHAELEAIRRINSPTIANALEFLGLAAKDQKFTDSTVHSMFPEMPAMLGYAVTATMRSRDPAKNAKRTRKEYWDHILKYPSPRIVVVQDLDDPPLGALWGEVNATIHRVLGCLGLITNGTVRDLDEVRPLEFQFLAAGLAVSHVYAHVEDFEVPVKVCGMQVQPGDLIHADKHGAIVIPEGLARQIPDGAVQVENYERPMLQLCKSPAFSTEKLAQLFQKPSI